MSEDWTYRIPYGDPARPDYRRRDEDDDDDGDREREAMIEKGRDMGRTMTNAGWEDKEDDDAE